MGKDIYNMKLHDSFILEAGNYPAYNVLRVPGGWLYTVYEEEGTSATFVPFNNEFMNKTKGSLYAINTKTN